MLNILNQKNIPIYLRTIAVIVLIFQYGNRIPELFIMAVKFDNPNWSVYHYVSVLFVLFITRSCVFIFFNKKWAWIGVTSGLLYDSIINLTFLVRGKFESEYSLIMFYLLLVFSIGALLIYLSKTALEYLQIRRALIFFFFLLSIILVIVYYCQPIYMQ